MDVNAVGATGTLYAKLVWTLSVHPNSSIDDLFTIELIGCSDYLQVPTVLAPNSLSFEIGTEA